MAAAEVGSSSNMNGKEQPASPSTLRKRRRRVPTTGASEDCHTCRKREVKCDRRRPYCSQCLDVGKDCSGYRTTLTWGVGVASRGKLRGMSLPVAKPAGQESSTVPSTPQFGRPRANTLQAPAGATDSHEDGPRKRIRLSSIQTNTPGPFHLHSPPEQSHFVSHGYGSPNTFTNWQQYPYPSQMPTFNNGYQDNFSQGYTTRREDLFPLHTAVGHSFTGLPWSPGSSVQSGSSSGFFDNNNNNMSPFTNYPRAPAPTAFVDPFTPQTQFQSSAPVHPHSRTHDVSQSSPLAPPLAQAPPLTEVPFGSSLRSASFSTDVRQRDIFEKPQVPQHASPQKPSAARPNLKRTRSAPVVAPSSKITEVEDDDEDYQVKEQPSAIVPFQPLPTLKNPNVSARVLNLLDYYDKKICPVLVTFDNEYNPYRKHIMHLAMQNSGLQNALGALVTNNIRMRYLEDVPSLTDGTYKEIISKAIGAPSPEEQHYKAKSIDFLNTQLADPSKAMDNSVLATLLILCLFHVCDSGFSKFKTQLAGVQKLLRMRSGMPRTEFHGWVEMFFAWFDVMTSAVNDRETQIQGQVFDLMDLGNNLGSVEEFSGCDGKLFKLIARLGRLNLLSQQRPVREMADNPSPVSTSYADPFFFNDILGISHVPIDLSESATDFPLQEMSNLERGPHQDNRAQFWMEWHNLHERLHAWKNSQLDGISLETPKLSGGQRAMLHMSESFRWSALLYLERLANPTIPSSSPNLQDLVNKALYHIREIGTNSCVTKFMLWPLFISGTECVDVSHRTLIRNRCIEIQKESGFYNNISGLELLERVWKENDEDVAASFPVKRGCGQQAFRWRNCMDRADGEYIVI